MDTLKSTTYWMSIDVLLSNEADPRYPFYSTTNVQWSLLSMKDDKAIIEQGEEVVQPENQVNSTLYNNHASSLASASSTTPSSIKQTLNKLDKIISKYQSDKVNLVVYGQFHLRQWLHQLAYRLSFKLSPVFFTFVDIKKEFTNLFPAADHVGSLQDTATYLDIDKEVIENGDRSQLVLAIFQSLATNAKEQFPRYESVKAGLEHTTYHGSCVSPINNQLAVKVCGLPTHLNDHDVAAYFRGLNIIRGGISFLLSEHGKRYGQAYVKFEDSQQRDLAIERHGQFMNQKPIRVYKINADKNFVPNVGGAAVIKALMNSKDESTDLTLIRMRGLPYTVMAIDVVNFFNSTAKVLDDEDGVLLLLSPDGRTTGDGYVIFKTSKIAEAAMGKHRGIIGSRYVELFRCSFEEALQTLSRAHTDYNINGRILVEQAMKSQGSVRDCLRLRGLPFSAKLQDIVSFMGEYADKIRTGGIHLCVNAKNRPSGDAYVQMLSQEDAIQAAVSKHRQHMGKRWIEVFQCSREEMTDAKINTYMIKNTSNNHYPSNRNNNYVNNGTKQNTNHKSDYQINPPISSICAIPAPVMTTVGLPMMQNWNQYQQDNVQYYSSSTSPGMNRVGGTTACVPPKEMPHYQTEYAQLPANPSIPMQYEDYCRRDNNLYYTYPTMDDLQRTRNQNVPSRNIEIYMV